MRVLYAVLAVAYDIAPAEGVIADDVFHLSERPLCKGVVLVFAVVSVLALLVLVVHESGELYSGIVSCAAPCIKVEVARRGELLVHYRIQRLCFHFPEVQHLVLSSAYGDSGLLADLGVYVLYTAEYDTHAVPHIVPAEHISGRCIVVDVLLTGFEVIVVLGYKVEPACCKAEVVLPLAGGVEAHGSFTGRAYCLVIFIGKVKESL